MIAGVQRVSPARESTLAAADQAAQYIRIGGMVAAGPLHVTIQVMLSRCKGCLADDGGHWHRNPHLRWNWLVALVSAYRLQGGFTTVGRGGAGPCRRPPYRSVSEEGRVPRPHSSVCCPWGGNLGLAEALGHLIQAGGLADVGIPGKDWLHHGGLARIRRRPHGFVTAGDHADHPSWATR